MKQVFHLTADDKDRGKIERVLRVYADGCPVPRSIKGSIEISSEVDLTPAWLSRPVDKFRVER
jgi:uncharacterized OsmC-like protein